MNELAKPYGLTREDITAADAKTAPVDADSVSLIDSEAGNVLKRLTWANLKAAVRSWLTSISNNWTAPQIAPLETLAFAATLDDDTSVGSVNKKITLTGNITALTLSSGVDGQTRHHRYKQDGIGGWTLTVSSIGGTAPVLNTTANAVTDVWYERVEGQWQAIMAIDYGVIA